MIHTMLYPVMGVWVVATALWAVSGRSRETMLWALAAHSLGLALVAMTLSASVMAALWGVGAVALAAAAMFSGAGRFARDLGMARLPMVLVLGLEIVLLLLVGGLLVAVDSPIWRPVGTNTLPQMADALATVGEYLGTRYAPGLVAVGLLLLTVLAGARLQENA